MIKRISITVLIALLLFISCSNESAENEAVSVSLAFNQNTTRGLSQSVTTASENSTTEDNDLTWYYTATPHSQRFTKGAKTAADKATITVTKTTDNKYSSNSFELSQGKWDFELWAENSAGKKLYYGKVENVLIIRQENNAPVSISIEISQFIPGETGTLTFKDITIRGQNESEVYPVNMATVDGHLVDLGGVTTLEAGQYTVVVSFVYDEIIYGSEKITVTIYSNQNTEISGFIEEETANASFNGEPTTESKVEYDKEQGEVYDKDKGTYYTLNANDGTFLGDTSPDIGDNLVLLDCSYSNSIPDEYINDYYYKDGYNWEVVGHTDTCGHKEYVDGDAGTKIEYAGGYGTKLEPYLIDSLDMWDYNHLYKSNIYLKWNGASTVNCTTLFTNPDINCSFDGNGATFDDTNTSLFNIVGHDSSNPIVLKNFTVNAHYIGVAGDAAAVAQEVWYDTTLSHVHVHGNLIGMYAASSFLNYLNCDKVIFNNCSSDAVIVNLRTAGNFAGSDLYADGVAGFINDVGEYELTIELNDSTFTGVLNQMKDTDNTVKYDFNYATNTNDGATITDNQYTTNCDSLYDENWIYLFSSNNSAFINDITGITTSDTGTIVTAMVGVDGDKATTATTADFYYVNGCDSVNVQVKDIGVALSTASDGSKIFTSSRVKRYSVERTTTEKSSIDVDSKKVKYYAKDGYNTVLEAIIVIQKNEKGHVIKCSIEKLN